MSLISNSQSQSRTPARSLVRGLTLIDAIAIVVGAIIGNGVFVKTATMAQYVGTPSLVLSVWIVAGALSLCGALAYAELGALMPEAGGEYVFLKEGYGEGVAFLYGWMRFWVAAPGSIAASAVVSATFLSQLIDLSWVGGQTGFAVLLLIVFSLLNCLSVATSGRIQSAMTLIKVLLIASLATGILFLAQGTSLNNFFVSNRTELTLSAYCAALLSALWAYDGWCNLATLGGEVRDPHKNIPRAFIMGMLIVLAIYLIINFAYFYALPFEDILTANSDLHPGAAPVALKAAMGFLGAASTGLLTLGFVISSIGAMNGGIMASPRTAFAMARDGLFFSFLSRVSARTHAPVMAVIVQGLMSIGLALSGTFEQLTNYVIFAVWIFYALTTSVVFILRRKKPEESRSYKTLGYPVLPALFIFLALILLIVTVYNSPVTTALGAGFILSGWPAYLYFKRRRRLNF